MSIPQRHLDLQAIAAQIMRDHGFEPDLPAAAQQQLASIAANDSPKRMKDGRDLRHLLWSSIDNETSRDLDQIEFAEHLPGGKTRVLVGIADVDALVAVNSPIDEHALNEGTTVYTGVKNFPMLPEALSMGSSSLLENQDRAAVVVEFTVDEGGTVAGCDAYRALVCNKARLVYDTVGPWLERTGPAPAKVAESAELQEQLGIQDACARALRDARFRHGALNIETIETRPVLLNEQVVGIVRQNKNLATELIEDLMIAVNETVARMFEAKQLPWIKRVVKTPERWNRIVELAQAAGGALPSAPDSKALNDFLMQRKAADPDHFPDLSLSVIKLLGPGEYVLDRPGVAESGHFGLAVSNYTHSTAPNRRFADLATQRLLKAAVAGRPAPYDESELASLARICTQKEDAARKVEREMSKRIAATALHDRIGESFDAVVTGVTPRGTFVRVLAPHAEGLLVRGAEGVDVGDRIRVTLVATNPEKGFIDFEKTRSPVGAP